MRIYKTRRNKRTRKTRRRQKRSRRHSKQRGGGFSYDIPSNAVVLHRSMDDDMMSPPMLMTKRDMDEMVSESERA